MKDIENNKFLISFGKNLKTIRTKKKLSLRQLAASCNVDHSNLARMEKGETNITILTVLDLANGLDVLPAEMFKF